MIFQILNTSLFINIDSKDVSSFDFEITMTGYQAEKHLAVAYLEKYHNVDHFILDNMKTMKNKYIEFRRQ